MLSEPDATAWAELERRLRSSMPGRAGTVRFGAAPGRLPRWWAYASAVAVPLLLPAVSVLEMRPVLACVGGLVIAGVALWQWVSPEGPSRTGRS